VKGWIGKIGDVDLSSGAIRSLHPDEATYQQFLGGVGMAARLLYESMQPGADPLSPENVLALMAGPVSGANFPGVGRVSFCGRSPLSGGWGESSMGGHLGQALKAAGYDGLLVHGASDHPVYLHVTGEGITLRDASALWGLDTFDTESSLKQTLGKQVQVASIGQAGENLVPMAGINHHHGSDSAARCGLGAVMGAKKLKAFVIEGKGGIAAADEAALTELRKKLVATYEKDWWVGTLKSGGTAWGTALSAQINDLPVKNWSLDSKEWKEQADKISGQAMEKAGFVVGRTACYRCPIGCRRIVHIDQEPWQLSESAAPEYETVGGLGSMTMLEDVGALCKANDLCNRYGLDTISCGNAIAWAIEAYERGVLTKADTDGLELRWNDGRVLVELVQRIAHRQGIGELLAGGSRGAAQKLGHGSEWAIQTKGLAPAMHHPRAMRGLEISYATGARGASHNEGGGYGKCGPSMDERAAASAVSVNRAMVNSSCVFCSFAVGPLSDDDTAAVLRAVTGHGFDTAEIMAVGSRIWQLRRAFNLHHCGMGGEADTLPPRMLSQLPEDAHFDQFLAAYYRVRGLDPSGKPYRATLESAGLSDVATTLQL
jgi:aldehyde:ferredoxin oxidoreductase